MLIVNAVAMLTHSVGDYIYRVEQPSIALGKTGKVTVITIHNISPWFETLCLSADVLILHLLSEHDLLPIIEERKRRGLPTVYELSDNIMSLHSGVGIRRWFSDPVNLALAFQCMTMSDAVQVTGQGLYEQFAFTNTRMVIFANQMNTLCMTKKPRKDRVMLGWAGSSGHKQDIEEILDVISLVMQDNNHVDFAIMGDEAIYRATTSVIPAGRVFHTPPGTLEEYLTFLQNLDIGIAPLQDNPYNCCRSDVKFLEYASRGVVPVLRSLTPYNITAKDGKTAFLYETPQQLAEILKRLACDTNLRNRLRSAAYDYVKDYRTENIHAERRLDFYSNLIDQSKMATALPPGVPLVRCCSGSEYYEVSTSHAESLIMEGIQHEAIGNYEEARKAYHLAAESRSDYALPWFWLGYSCLRQGVTAADTAGWFDEAINRNPRSLRAHWLKAQALKGGDPVTAFEGLATLLKHWPAYAPAAFSMAEILETHGVFEEARRWYDEALQSNPFFSPALVGLGRIYNILGESEKAAVAYETAADLAPAWAEAQYCIACLCFSRNDREKAVEYCSRTLIADSSHAGVQNLLNNILSGQQYREESDMHS